MRKLMLIVMTIACLGITGCGSKMRRIDPAAVNDSVAPDETAIVFMRSSIAGALVKAPVFEAAEDGTLKHIAIMHSRTKYLHRTSPGKHRYIVCGESSEMLEADMEAGKTYYVYVNPRLGWFKARFSFSPVSDLTDETFKNDFMRYAWITNKPQAEEWFLDNLPSLRKKYINALEDYNEEKPEDRKIILPEYGAITPIR